VNPDTPLRSWLFVPGTLADRFGRASTSGADAIVLDLEDAVASDKKTDARDAVSEWLRTDRTEGAARFVRINAPGSDWIDDDCDWLRPLASFIDGIVVPKVEIAEAIEGVAAAIPETPVVPLLETARGILNAVEIIRADIDMPAILFGAEDLTAELGIPRTLEGTELLWARSQVVLAAAVIGAEPIDAVWVDLASPEALLADATRARALGFRGKMAIHPDQVRVINRAFSPSSEEIAAARRVVEADDRAREQGEGVFRLDDRMVDAPVVLRARRVLELAARMGTER
jgi:citrate lyase subunit beta/citryl-CoA lyase